MIVTMMIMILTITSRQAILAPNVTTLRLNALATAYGALVPCFFNLLSIVWAPLAEPFSIPL